jgi:tight adherence protein B
MELLIPVLAFATTSVLVWGIQVIVGGRQRTLAARLATYGHPSGVIATAPPAGIIRVGRRRIALPGLERALSRGGYADRVADDLARADVPLRVGEYLLVRWLVSVAVAYVLWRATGQFAIAAVLGVIGYFLPRLYVRFRRARRARILEEQLVDGLTLMASSLRAGFSFLQAVEAVTREHPAPISAEFKLLLEDIAVGATVEDALCRLAERTDSEELDMAVTAMLIQRSTGGNLAEVLENLATTVRERMRIRREVHTLTAQQRYASYIVGALPIIMFGLLAAMNPKYLFALFGTELGHLLLAVAIFFELIGFIVIRWLMDINV